MSTRRRGRTLGTILLVGAIVAVLAAASQVSHMLFDRPPPAPVIAPSASAGGPSGGAPPAPGADDSGLFQVALAEGGVDAFRDGNWVPVQRGDLLSKTDLVRTLAGGRAVLRLSVGTEIELRERVEIRLDRLSAAGASVDLRRGKLVARVAGAADALAITARDTRTSNDGPAHFVVLADEHGQVSVATLKGSARFAAAGKTVTVPAGSETRSRLGEPPDDPEKIPEEVLLQVVWPAAEKHAGAAALQGRAEPAALVTVNGTPVAVAPDGRFAAMVPLRDGANLVQVRAEDLAGRTREASTTLLRRPPRRPKLAPEPAELWKK